MTLFRLTLLGGALAMALGPVCAAETEADTALRFLQRLSTQYAVLVMRSFVDLTYDALTVEPGTNSVILSGVRLYPELDWDEEGACLIEIDRVVSGSSYGLETTQSRFELSGVTAPAACFAPEIGGTMQGFGYPGLAAETVSIDLAYDLPSASANIAIQAALVDAGDVNLSAALDYLWFRFPADGGDPVPVVILGQAELSIENDGLWERVAPLLAAQFGDPAALPQMAQLGLGQFFTEGGSRNPTPRETALMENVQAELARFVADQDRIVITAAPERGVFLDPDTFEDPYAAIEALDPVVSGVPVAYRAIVAPELLSAALSGGAGLDDAARLEIGTALVTGVGAPMAPDEGRALLAPLADAWNAEAAAVLATALADGGDPAEAYAMTLRAMAAGAGRLSGQADTLEAALAPAEMLRLQAEIAAAWPGADADTAASTALIAAGDVPGLRQRAYAATGGAGVPRDYAAAYYWASLAAAAGDRGAVNLRRRMDQRFGADPAWRAAARAAGSRALATWTADGLGATITSRVK